MKLVYLHQYYKTPENAGGSRSYFIVQELIRNGYDVRVLASPLGKTMNLDESVIRVGLSYSPKHSFFRRSLCFISFMVMSTYYLLKIRPSIVYATSTPLTVSIPALIGNFFLGIDYVFEVRDLWPKIPIEMGILRFRPLIYVLEKLESLTYSNSSHIVALSDGMKEGILAVNPNCIISVIPNMAKPSVYLDQHVENTSFAEKSDYVIYFGAVGRANGMSVLPDLIEAFDSKLKVLIFAKHGYYRDYLSELQYKYGKDLLEVREARPFHEIIPYIVGAKFSLVLFSDFRCLESNSPNKLFDSLSLGTPIVVNKEGWMKRLVEKERCGYYFDGKNVIGLNWSVEEMESLRSNAKRVVRDSYSNERLVGKVIKIVDDVKNI